MRRKMFSVMLTLCMVLMLMPQMVFADTYGEFEYSVSDGKVTITGYTGKGDAVVIPENINGKPVTAIGSNAFSFKEFNSVTIPDGITSIGDSAFIGCPCISSVVLPGSVTSVGDMAFNHCNSLFAVFISAQSAISYGYNPFPEMASTVKYSLNQSTHEASIVDIALACYSEDHYVSSVNIPEKICGYPVTEVAPDQRGKVGGHKCAGEGATCRVPQVCSICGKTFGPHSYTQENKDLNGALKSAGNCLAEAVYYYSCVHCNEIEGNDNHTFKGDKDSSNHTGIKVWASNETQHKKCWDCCSADATNYEDHTWTDGKCTECGYACTHKDENRNHDCDICGKTTSKHTGGTATCTKQAECSYCKEAYGDKDSSNHTGIKVWASNETQHKKYWNCCNADATDYENHSWNDGKCSVCDYICKHTGGTATCTKQAVCSYCEKAYGNVESSNHSLDNIPAKEATVIEKGNIEYWQCTECEKCFADENGTDEISLEETVLRKLPPEIIEGAGQIVSEGSKEELIFRSNAAFSDFIRVELDGTELDESCYSKEEGSTIVTLDANFVSTLDAGEYTIGIVSDGGTAETTFTVKEAPAPSGNADKYSGLKDNKKGSVRTGDDTSLALWIVLMLLSGIGIYLTSARTARATADRKNTGK